MHSLRRESSTEGYFFYFYHNCTKNYLIKWALKADVLPGGRCKLQWEGVTAVSGCIKPSFHPRSVSGHKATPEQVPLQPESLHTLTQLCHLCGFTQAV